MLENAEHIPLEASDAIVRATRSAGKPKSNIRTFRKKVK